MNEPAASMSRPPSRNLVRQALERLNITNPVQRRAAALHLMLPIDSVASIEVGVDDGTLTWRHAHVRISADPIADAAAIAALGQRDSDCFLDLNAEPHTWVKTVRTGTRRLVFGPDLLFGTPLLALDEFITDTAVSHLLKAIVAGENVSVPAVLTHPDGHALMERTGAVWMLRDAHVPGLPALSSAPVTSRTVSRAIEEVAKELNAQVVGFDSPTAAGQGIVNTTAHFITLDGTRVSCPLTLTAHTRVAGVAEPVTRQATNAEAGPDMVVEGVLACGSVVVVHRASGLRLIRRS